MQKTNNVSKRNSTLDIVRIASVLLVMMVHFFLYTGFYSEPMVGSKMFLMCFMRTFFSACVPMFLLLSGYLMSKKTISKKYFFGISKTLITYVMAGIACIIYKASYLKQTYTTKSAILSFFDFSAANYAWYIEMYIGLFFLIPFLNLIYNNLQTKKQKQLLVVIMVCLTAVPTLFNVYNLNTPSWWLSPSSSDIFNAILPDWWIGFYPVTFFFTGAYLKEYGLQLKTKTVAFLLILTTLAFTVFNFWRSYGTGFITSYYAYWYGFQPYVTAVLLFELLNRIKCDKLPDAGKYVLWKISDLVLCMYLVSYIFDSYIYEKLCENVPVMQDRLNYFIPCVLFVFVCSLALSFIIHLFEIVIKETYYSIKKKINSLKNKNNESVLNLCFIIFMAVGLIISFAKAPLGFGGNDEAFYLTVPHRLGLSDQLFADEWNLAQMSGLLTMPFVWLYRTIVGSTEGIILAFRYLYIIVHALVVIFAYKRLKSYGYFVAAGLALYFVYTPYNIMALSYNTMALDLLLLGGVLLSTSNKMWHYSLSGVCLAGAVLCSPYLLIVYAVYFVCVMLHTFGLKKTTIKEDIFSIKVFLYFTLGAGILAAAFAIFVALTCGFKAVFDNLPLMLLDPDHPQVALSDKLKDYFNAILYCHNRMKTVIYSYIALLIIMAIDRKRKNHRGFYIITSSIFTLCTLLMFYPTSLTHTYNHIMMPMIFIGITAYILCDDKPRKIFGTIFMGGVLYSVCITLASNQRFYVIAMVCSLINIASYIFLAQLIKEMKERPDDCPYGVILKNTSIGVATFVICILAIMQINVKNNHCFWESPPDTLKTEITSGPAKGIYTTESNAAVYTAIEQDLEFYDKVPKGDILMLTERTWCYLKPNDLPYGSFSAWIAGENIGALSRLELFYEVNPDKIPEYIYVPKKSNFDTAQIAANAEQKGYTVIENEVSYKLSKFE